MRREYIRTMSKNADDGCSLEVSSTFHPCFIDIFAVIYFCVLFEKMCKSYHRAFLFVKRRFLYPLGILQSTVCWHILLSFYLIVGGWRRVENREGRVVSENVSKSTSRFSSGR